MPPGSVGLTVGEGTEFSAGGLRSEASAFASAERLRPRRRMRSGNDGPAAIPRPASLSDCHFALNPDPISCSAQTSERLADFAQTERVKIGADCDPSVVGVFFA